MTHRFAICLAIASSIFVTPQPAAAAITFNHVFNTVDAVEDSSLYGVTVTATLAGQSTPITADFYFYSEEAMQRCQRMALLAMSKPGKSPPKRKPPAAKPSIPSIRDLGKSRIWTGAAAETGAGAAAGRRGVCASLQLFGSRRAGCMAPMRALLRRDEGGARAIGSVIGSASSPRVIAVFRRELVRAVAAPGSARGRNGKCVIDICRVT